MSEEAQRAVRVPAHLAVRYQSPYHRFSSQAYDLSATGAFVESERLDSPGTAASLDVFSYLSRDPMRFQVRVAHSTTKERPGMGLEFVETDPANRQAVERYCALFRGERRVVMVDDDPALLRMMGRFVSREAMDFVGIDLPVHTEEVLQRFRPQLILLDVMMPNMDGAQLALRLRQNPATRDIPIVFYSAASRTKLPKELHDLPFLPKGARRQQVLEVIEASLGVDVSDRKTD